MDPRDSAALADADDQGRTESDHTGSGIVANGTRPELSAYSLAVLDALLAKDRRAIYMRRVCIGCGGVRSCGNTDGVVA